MVENGFQVYTNVYGQEEEVPGTKPLKVTIREAYQIAQYSAGVVSYRSGFSDILALQPELHHVVINPDDRAMRFDDCSVLGNAKKLLNVVYDPDAEEELIRQIVDYFPV